FVSPRKRFRDSVIAVKSSCVNDQLAVPAVIVLRSQSRLEPLEHPGTALPQNGAWLPRDVLAKQLGSVHGRACAQIAKRGDATDRRLAEEVAPVLALHAAPH